MGAETDEFGDQAVDFYGSSYIVDPKGNYVAGPASTTEEKLIVCEIDLDEIRRTRYDWQFYRDRRPDAYGSIVEP